MRWTLISVLATTVLAVARAHTTTVTPSDHRLIPSSVREVLRLLQITALPRPRRDRGHVLHWSAWRPPPPTPSHPSPPLLEQHRRHSNHLTNSNDPPVDELQPP